MHTLIAAASALIATTTASGGLQLPSDGPATFDVAGVRLNMTPNETRMALAKAGYHVTRTTDAHDFAQLAAMKVEERRRGNVLRTPVAKETGGIEAAGPHGATIGISFAQLRSGPRADRITWSIGDDRQTAASFMQQVQERYGKPTMKPDPYDATWCSQQDHCTPLTSPRSPVLTASSMGRNVLALTAGPDAGRAAQADMDAEVDRLVPKTDRSAF